MKKIFIIGVGWEQIPLVKKAKERGLYVIATTWWKKEQIPADKLYSVDSRDLDALEQIMQTERPDCVVADECDYSMYAVSYLTEKYHLPGPKLKTQTITNNKFLQRECIKGTNVLQPAYQLCWNMETAKDFARQIGYPVIIKPLDNRGSIGVSKVAGETELPAAWFQAVSHSHSRMCIVEQYISGQVLTADGFCDSEKFEFIAASTKEMYSDNDNVAKILYYPGKLSGECLQELKENAEAVAEAIGMTYGFAHMEFMLEDDTGKLYLIEAANRGGGVFISSLILDQITGIDYTNALLDLALGKEVKVSCYQTYISKAMLYFLELQGTRLVQKEMQGLSEGCRAIYINAYQEGHGVESEASAGRQGVLVYGGSDFEKMLEQGKVFEQQYCAGEEEFFALF